jgi:hypothetical protein
MDLQLLAKSKRTFDRRRGRAALFDKRSRRSFSGKRVLCNIRLRKECIVHDRHLLEELGDRRTTFHIGTAGGLRDVVRAIKSQATSNVRRNGKGESNETASLK